MKSFALSLFLTVAAWSVMGQHSDAKRNAVLFNGQANHDFLTLFAGEDLDYAGAYVTLFADEQMGMGTDTVIYHADRSILRLASVGDEHEYLTFTFHHQPGSKAIDRCVITGFPAYVVDFYLSYWPDRVRAENPKQNELVYSYNMGDRIGIELGANVARIEITKDERYQLEN